jgi:hypothetical protein
MADGILLSTKGAFGDTGYLGQPLAGVTLAGYFELGGSVSKSLRNLVRPDLPALKLGTPTVSANYLTGDNSGNGMNLQLAETGSYTWLVVARAPGGVDTTPGATLHMLNNRRADVTPNDGTTFYMGPTPQFQGNSYVNVSGTPTAFGAVRTIPNRTAWRIGILREEEGVSMRAYDQTAGASSFATQTAPRIIGPAPIHAFCRASAGGRTGDATSALDIAAVAIIQSKLTDDQVISLTSFVRARMAARSITA